MKKITTLIVALMALTATASNYITRGDGTTYTLESLSQIDGSNVTKADGKFFLADTVTIVQGDTFRLEGAPTIYCGNGFVLDIQGDASFLAPVSVAAFMPDTVDGVAAVPYEIRIDNDSAKVDFQNVWFEGIGVRILHAKEVNLSNCIFDKHNGNNAGAVMISGSGNNVNIVACAFDSCAKAGVASAANSYSNIRIEGSEFYYNSTNNGNVPQINITAGPAVVVKGNTVVGDTTLTNVGGIAVGNLMMAEDTFNIAVEDNYISNNRYGLTFTGPMNGTISSNRILSNKYATNAMTGGSGISLYYTGSDNKVTLRDNEIKDNLWGLTFLGNSYYGGNNVDMGTYDDYGNNTIGDNGNGGVLYALYNNQADSVWAVGNNWTDVNSNDSADIAQVIFDHSDNASLGVVVFMPVKSTNAISHTTYSGKAGTEAVYDLYGRRMNGKLESLPHGIYIVKGKKVKK